MNKHLRFHLLEPVAWGFQWSSPVSTNLLLYLCNCMYTYLYNLYVSVYAHTHTHTHIYIDLHNFQQMTFE